MTKFIFLNNISDLRVIPQDLLKINDAKIFSFNIDVHQKLQSQKIDHQIADDFLSLNERLKIFDQIAEFLSWHSKISIDNCSLEGVNLLKIFDSHEFLSYLMPNLIDLLIIKKIIEKEKPTKIVATSQLSKLIETITKGKNIETEFFENKIKKDLLWDKITAKYNVGKIPLTFTLSRKKYLKIKNLLETFSAFFFSFWFDLKNSKKKSIVFLEFNPQLFSKLFQEMKNYDGNVILINQRRSAIWSKKSVDVIRKSKCKILKLDDVLNKDEKAKIPFLVDFYSKKIDELWKNSNIFNDIFQIEGCSFWNIIKEVFMKTYSERLSFYISLVLSAKKVFEKIDLRCIVSLNEMGETEKTFLEVNNKKIPSILLEHGFIERIDKTKRFDILSEYISFKDKIAVWGEMKKKWLINEYHIDPSRIIVTGSPRHDDYFCSKLETKDKYEKTLLLAPNPINETNGQSNTNLKIQFNESIKEILSIIKKFENVKIIVKLHPIQLTHNEEIKSLITKLDSSIPVYLWTSVIDTINSADVVMVLSPEIHATPTMLLESMILDKPTMNVYFNEEIPQYEHVRNNAVLTVSNNDDLENKLKKILFDEEFQDELKVNANHFVRKFLDNRGNASEKFASILKSY
ncbi:hypothetical protein NZNM25_19470 [Nitrosopumilus zosterae]|uniref:UDP-N-acetylglucosamine 2-epimerase domain-containing protein n=1 Tax=Nitrosopumilus zosterae TaxID=718286 RepID=A0A2S2KU61_9ARCH|nr:hypothetical protein [Nitrosopumilus zosterae]BDQ31806.1 hypothetical protein NZOSNM25_001944 [Nitrosopumilus zosterae]GBH35156.1 hypothetical protein NZNM25_19470 [Nitrosopumilus zosterae]